MKPTQEMIDRFLSWQLPEDFNPDGGITYKPLPYDHKPSGTNLLCSQQAKAMLEHVLATTDIEGGN